MARPENAAQARLLARLRDDGPVSRAELAELLPVGRTRALAELDALTARGLVHQAGPAASRGGRRSALIALVPELRFVGVDIGATSIDVAVTDAHMRVLAHEAERSDVRNGPDAVLEQMLGILDRLRQGGELGEGGTVHAMGIGVPGPVRHRDGVPVAPPIMPGWDRFPLRDFVSRRLGCPVVVDNDVNMMAVGEAHAGTAKSVADFLFIKIGTGIGAGIVVDGRVYRGVTGSAGDIGHVQVEEFGPTCACGSTGCLEAFFGGAALARDALAAARSGRSAPLAELFAREGRLDAHDVSVAAAAGDPVASALIREGGRRVGQVLASLVSFFNPGLIVIGGGVAATGHALLAEIRSVVYRRSTPLATGNLPIVLSELGGLAGVVGAARMASDEVLALPETG